MTICNALKIGAEKFEFFGKLVRLQLLRLSSDFEYLSGIVFITECCCLRLEKFEIRVQARKSGWTPTTVASLPWILDTLAERSFQIIWRPFSDQWRWWCAFFVFETFDAGMDCCQIVMICGCRFLITHSSPKSCCSAKALATPLLSLANRYARTDQENLECCLKWTWADGYVPPGVRAAVFSGSLWFRHASS